MALSGEAELPAWAQGTPEGRRIVELLWNPPAPGPGRGPRPRLTLAEVVAAGVEIADGHGLVELSMRKVAAALGVGVMSLYTYVPGRSELVELMIDRVYAEHGLPDRAGSWREQLEFLVRQTYALYQRHPWLLDHNSARLPIGPHVMDVEEAGYAAVARAGFAGVDNTAVCNFVGWQVLGAARSLIGEANEERHTGVSAEAYWDARASFWFTYFDPERYPAMAAVHAAGGFDNPLGYSFDEVVRRLLDAVERTRPAP